MYSRSNIFRIICCCFLLCTFSSCWIARAYRIRHLNLTDHTKLPFTTIAAADIAKPFAHSNNSVLKNKIERLADTVIAGTETAAFMVIRNDSIVYEKYFMGFSATSLLPSNSMAKSYTGTLAAIALAEGKIKSADEPITNYLPELAKRDDRYYNITIRHLLDMRSGLQFNEGSYGLRDDAIRTGLSRNVERQVLKTKIAGPPGKFRYQSINTQLLGLVIERATGKPLQEYLETKLWKVMGTGHPATWNMDSKKHKQVIMSAGLNATARDFAKLGRLYLNKGRVGDIQVIPEAWVNAIASVDTMEQNGGYKNQFWNNRVNRLFTNGDTAKIHSKRKKYVTIQPVEEGYRLSYRTAGYSARGFMNQIMYIHPEKQVIIIRIGRGWKKGSRFIQSMYHLAEEL